MCFSYQIFIVVNMKIETCFLLNFLLKKDLKKLTDENRFGIEN